MHLFIIWILLYLSFSATNKSFHTSNSALLISCDFSTNCWSKLKLTSSAHSFLHNQSTPSIYCATFLDRRSEIWCRMWTSGFQHLFEQPPEFLSSNFRTSGFRTSRSENSTSNPSPFMFSRFPLFDFRTFDFQTSGSENPTYSHSPFL